MPRVLAGTADPTLTTGQGQSAILYSETGTNTVWLNAGTPQGPNWVRLAPPPSTPAPTPSPSPSPGAHSVSVSKPVPKPGADAFA